MNVFKELKKPIVLFTNFWDANALINTDGLLIKIDNQIHPINLSDQNKNNFSVYSIALSHPSFEKLPNVQKAFKGRLDFFCPVYNLLQRYKQDNNWDKYVEDYKNLMRERRSQSVKWINSLDINHIYILCCWENTSGKSHCHRDILYTAMLNSKLTKEKIYPIYRSGSPLSESKIINQLPLD